MERSVISGECSAGFPGFRFAESGLHAAAVGL